MPAGSPRSNHPDLDAGRCPIPQDSSDAALLNFCLMARAPRQRVLALVSCFAILLAAGAYVWLKAVSAFRHPIIALRLIRSDAPSKIRVPVRGVRRTDLRNSWGVSRSGGR